MMLVYEAKTIGQLRFVHNISFPKNTPKCSFRQIDIQINSSCVCFVVLVIVVGAAVDDDGDDKLVMLAVMTIKKITMDVSVVLVKW